VTYLGNVLEAVHDEAFQSQRVQNLVVADEQLAQAVQALDLAQQDETVQRVVAQVQLLQLGEPAQLVEVGVVHDQVEAHVGQVEFLDHLVELGTGKHFERVAVDVEHLVRLNFSVAALHKTFVAELGLGVFGVDSVFLEVESLHFSLPLFLDDLDDGVFLSLFLGCSEAGLCGKGCVVDDFHL
jgi:hypothetical protein